ncbi:hypothetical protein Trydic_g15504 [Trypoxylus dichotomus]
MRENTCPELEKPRAQKNSATTQITIEAPSHTLYCKELADCSAYLREQTLVIGVVVIHTRTSFSESHYYRDRALDPQIQGYRVPQKISTPDT